MEQKAILALFDFDGTMISGDSIVPFILFARWRGDMGWGQFFRACWQGMQFKIGLKTGGEMKKSALSFYRGLSPQRRDALDRAFAEKIEKQVYSKARAVLATHKRAGRMTVLVSASTENYMRYVSELLGFDALICTPVDEEGRVGENCRGEEKVKRIRKWIGENRLAVDFSASFAYGDSKGDLPMLRLCDRGTMVNAKASLKKAAPDLPKETWKI